MFDAPPLIATIVLGIGLAFILGTVANRLRISPLVGYLLAGVVVGPFTPGFVADQALAQQLANIGVILLMFGVGLHFSIKDLLSVYPIAVPGAVLQVTVSSLLGMVLALLVGWHIGTGLVFGIALSNASTVVLTRALQERRLFSTERGHVTVGWMVVQDFLMILVLVLLPPAAAAFADPNVRTPAGIDVAAFATTLGITLAKVAAFVALMLLVGRRLIPMLLHYVAHTGSRELFRLAVLSVALGVAFAASELFGVSFALGAFFAGMTLSESALSQVAAEESLPLRDAFAVLFFVSVGMLFDPMIVLAEPVLILGGLLIVLVVNPGAAFLLARLLGGGRDAALLIAAGLSQIGEFSYILANLGIWLGVLPEQARQLILATSIISILLNPLAFVMLGWWQRRQPAPAAAPPAATAMEEELPLSNLTDHAVLIGYGRVGRLVGPELRKRGWPLVVVETADEAVSQLKTASIEVIEGNAADGRVLRAANLGKAKLLLVAIPDAFEAGQIVEQARSQNPELEIVARAHFDAEVEHLLEHGANAVVMGEREIARSMLERAAATPTDETT